VPGLAMSGLVHLSSVQDDFFEFDEARGQLTGRRTRRVIRLGDKVQVQIAKVDSFKKQVDFRLAREERKERDDRYRPQHRPQERQQSRPQTPPRSFKSQPARPQTPARNFKPQPARAQIPSSHSRSKFGGQRRRR